MGNSDDENGEIRLTENNLRPAGDHQPVQQQLWALPIPGKADSPDDHQRPAGQTPAGVRGWKKRPGLVICGRPLPCHRPDPAKKSNRRNL